MRKHRAQLHIKPCLATHFLSLSKGPDIDLNVRMFTEDVHVAIMPIGGRAYRQKEFAVEFRGEEPDNERAKEIVGELGEFDRYDTAGMVCDAVENIARYLAWEGQAVFEIIEHEKKICINGVTPQNLVKFFNWHLQIIPPGDWGLWRRKFSFVSNTKVWKVKIPHELGGVRGYKKILKKLRKYNRLGPGFYKRNLERGILQGDFNLLRYIRDSDMYINSITRAWGWNRRDRSQEKCTEFYSFHRMLRFKYAQALLREHIIEEINHLLDRLEIKSKLIVTGLPTSKELLKIRSDMREGEISFSAVSDRVAM